MSTTVIATLTLTDLDRHLEDAAAYYRRLPPALRECPAAAVSLAMKLAGGNVRRLVADDDRRGVTVVNAPAW